MEDAMPNTRLHSHLSISVLVWFFLFSLPDLLQAKNPDLSFWETNLSQAEEGTTPLPDYDHEILVNGDTVHVMWITTLEDGGKAVNYRRSLDGGTTFGPVVRVATFTSGQSLLTNNAYRRMAVNGNDVCIFHAYYGQGASWYGVLGVSRSTDNGATFAGVEALYNAADAHHIYDIYAIADQGRTGVCFRDQVNWNNNCAAYALLSEDHGETWTNRNVFSFSDSSLSWGIGDALLKGDDIHVLHRGAYYSYGLQQGVLRLATSNDAGVSFTSHVLSVPSGSGADKTSPLQEENHVPKMAAAGNTVAVTWAGLDASDVLSVFATLSRDRGANFDTPAILNQENGTVAIQAGQETLALSGDHLYVVYQGTDGATHLRRGTPNGFVSGDTVLTLAPGTYYGDSGWWPMVRTDPTDATGASATVLSDWPQAVQTVDGGQTLTNPALVSPRFSYSGSLTSGARRPHCAMDAQGRLHYVVEARYYSTALCNGYCDFDIIYRRIDPAPAPGNNPENKALHLANDADNALFGNMHIPAGATNTLSTTMTLEAWVRPYDGGQTTGSTSQERPIAFKRAASSSIVYGLATTNITAGRVYAARLKTNAGEWILSSTTALVTLEQWTHVAMVYDATASGNNLLLYLNGEFVSSLEAGGTIDQGNGDFFAGYYGIYDVDEIRIWNVARSASDIAQNFDRRLAGSEAGLIAYYPFDGSTTRNATWTGTGARVAAGDGVLMYKETYLDGAPLQPDAPVVVSPMFNLLLLQ